MIPFARNGGVLEDVFGLAAHIPPAIICSFIEISEKDFRSKYRAQKVISHPFPPSLIISPNTKIARHVRQAILISKPGGGLFIGGFAVHYFPCRSHRTNSVCVSPMGNKTVCVPQSISFRFTIVPPPFGINFFSKKHAVIIQCVAFQHRKQTRPHPWVNFCAGCF